MMIRFCCYLIISAISGVLFAFPLVSNSTFPTSQNSTTEGNYNQFTESASTYSGTPPGEPCKNTLDCLSRGPFTYCSEKGVCTCIFTDLGIADVEGQCRRFRIGDPCNNTEQCKRFDTNSRCNGTGTCVCEDGFDVMVFCLASLDLPPIDIPLPSITYVPNYSSDTSYSGSNSYTSPSDSSRVFLIIFGSIGAVFLAFFSALCRIRWKSAKPAGLVWSRNRAVESRSNHLPRSCKYRAYHKSLTSFGDAPQRLVVPRSSVICRRNCTQLKNTGWNRTFARLRMR